MTSKLSKSRSSKPTRFRYIQPYHAQSMSQNERISFKKEIKDKELEYNQIGILSYAPHFYKYLNLDAALKCIDNGTLQFVEPSRWQDKYERRFYTADYSSQKVNEPEDCPILFATCMTTTRFDEAAWKLYTYEQTGLGAYCVEFQINKHKFRQKLVKSLEYKDRVYEGVVMYCSPSMIDKIHQKKIEKRGIMTNNTHYENYVMKHTGVPYITNYLNLLLMKRDAFKHESETRFFIVKNDKKGTSKSQQKIIDDKVEYGEAILLKNIDWIEIIEKVYINAEEDSREYGLLSDALKKQLDKKYEGKTDPKEIKEKNDIWNNKLKPEPYFIYGKALDTPLVME